MGSLNSFPPAWRGTSVYHEMYAGKSQKYTIGWPVNQNSVRANKGFVSGSKPSDQGRLRNSISAAIPMLAIVHITNVTRAANAASGVRSVGCSRRQAR